MPTRGRARTPRPPSATALLLALIDEAFDHVAWHGTTLLGGLRGLSAAAAAWRPSPRRHNIWEVAVHAAYWKYAVRRRLVGDKRGAFPLEGSNWFRRPAGTVADGAWQEDLRLLVEQHRLLRAAVAGLSARQLTQPIGSRSSVAYMVRGIAAHDLYHAGQIQLLKRLRR